MKTREIRTEVDIDAPVATVWEILTNFDAFPDWNPFVLGMQGQLREGERLTMRLRIPDSFSSTMKPRLLKVEPERELRWLGHTVAPGIFDGEHIFEMEPTGTGCHLAHREEFRGLLAGPVLMLLGKRLTRGYFMMNQALKERAET